MAEAYTVVNRVNRVVKCTWDGRHLEIEPYGQGIFTVEQAHQFKRWNPQMGSLDPQSGLMNFLVGIKELGDPCEPLKEEVLIDPKTGKPHVEVWDRNRLTGSRPSDIVAGDNGLYSEQMWRRGQGQDLNFDGR